MNVLVDTGVWYSFIDQREMINDRGAIESLFEGLQFAFVLMPWPVVYETIRTRLSKNRIALDRLQIVLEKPNIFHVDDAPYREDALQMVFALSVQRKPPRPISMVDCLLRLILEDKNLKIDKFATYNEKDFSDVCQRELIEMVR